ncbi:MAG: tRNA preQ1(34) S-adenosylmethionine ribosyltransferase-isomerase QueA [Saccharofermentanales bacterium]
MNKNDYFYELPEPLIAQHPAARRDASRLMYLDGMSGDIRHLLFSDVAGLLRSGDCLVVNNTRVIPARLLGVRKDTGTPVEVLLLKRIAGDDWEVIVRPGRKLRAGHTAVFISDILECTVLNVKDDGNRIVRFKYPGIWEEILDQAGQIPLPPYIHAKLANEDRERYQTVYAKESGSAAAPTAGLHFTDELLLKLRGQGVRVAEVTLHVGLGTFRPVKTARIEDHIMHSEYYRIDAEAADTINSTVSEGGRIIGVGTTSCRVLESTMNQYGRICACEGETDIFIYPGYDFKILDALITNFHLPESTLIMLVSAFSGKENIFHAYEEAIRNEYRFFSFGDAMFLTRRRLNDQQE